MNARVEAIGAVAMSEGARVKLCGMTCEADIAAVNEALPDLCGFVVEVPGRRRSLSAARAAELAGLLDQRICPVAVVFDNPLEDVLVLARGGAFKVIQLHGHEDDDYVCAVAQTGVVVVKAISVADAEDVAQANASPADLVLLDNGAGGTGKQFDWSLLDGMKRPFLLAGGLGPQNAADAVKNGLPYGLWGVDTSSGIETDGAKDASKIKAAVAAVRSCWL